MIHCMRKLLCVFLCHCECTQCWPEVGVLATPSVHIGAWQSACQHRPSIKLTAPSACQLRSEATSITHRAQISDA